MVKEITAGILMIEKDKAVQAILGEGAKARFEELDQLSEEQRIRYLPLAELLMQKMVLEHSFVMPNYNDISFMNLDSFIVFGSIASRHFLRGRVFSILGGEQFFVSYKHAKDFASLNKNDTHYNIEGNLIPVPVVEWFDFENNPCMALPLFEPVNELPEDSLMVHELSVQDCEVFTVKDEKSEERFLTLKLYETYFMSPINMDRASKFTVKDWERLFLWHDILAVEGIPDGLLGQVIRELNYLEGGLSL